MELTDAECVERCRNGQTAAFRQLVLRYQRPVLAYLSGRAGGRDMAEEAAQETFVRAFCDLDKLKRPSAFYPWLLAIARHVVQEMNREGRRHHPVDKNALTCRDERPSEDVDVRSAVAQLPPACQRVVVLRYYGRMSCREVAERLGLSVGSVTKTLSRAHSILRRHLRPTERDAT